jgi:hypothetical protein
MNLLNPYTWAKRLGYFLALSILIFSRRTILSAHPKHVTYFHILFFPPPYKKVSEHVTNLQFNGAVNTRRFLHYA